MGVNGYSDKLIAIADEQEALGRPLPPVISWLSSGRKGDFNAQTAKWRTEVEAWEEAHATSAAGEACVCGKPTSCAVRWSELASSYNSQDELEQKSKYGDDEWRYELLARFGVPRPNLDVIRRHFNDNASMKAANEWMRNGAEWSLLLIGGNGCGKSTAAAWGAHQLLCRSYRPVWIDCVRQCEAPMYGMEAERLRWRCRTSNALVLDDLGGGRRERESQFWLAWLDDVVGSRANERKKTIITTNRSPDELKAWLGERLVDRLRTGVIHSSGEKSFRGQRSSTEVA